MPFGPAVPRPPTIQGANGSVLVVPITASVALGANEIVVPPTTAGAAVSPGEEGEVVPPTTIDPPAVSVWLSMMYWPWALGVMVCVPRVSKGEVGVGEEEGRLRVVVLEPMMSTGGWVPTAVSSITGVLEAPEPIMRGVLGERVWPAMMYWDCEFVVRVCPFIMTGVDVGGLSRA